MAERTFDLHVLRMNTEYMRLNLSRLTSTNPSPEELYGFCYIDPDSIMRYQIGIGRIQGEIALNTELIPKKYLPFYLRHEYVEFMEKVKWYKDNIKTPSVHEQTMMHSRAVEAEYMLAQKRHMLDEYHAFAMEHGTRPEGLAAVIRINAYERISTSSQK